MTSTPETEGPGPHREPRHAPELRWERQPPIRPSAPDKAAWFASSGGVTIGMVVWVPDRRRWTWQIYGVSMKWYGRGDGAARTDAEAKRALTKGWEGWLKAAGLW